MGDETRISMLTTQDVESEVLDAGMTMSATLSTVD
jgi:hypothetical protein